MNDVLNGINFTEREIDIISTLPSLRTSKKIGGFLGISPKTVDYHLQNIVKKIEESTKISTYSPRQIIIDFIDAYDQQFLLKKHYFALCQQKRFEKELIRLKTIISSKNCLLLWNDSQKDILTNQLEKHLSIAGYQVTVKKWSTECTDTKLNQLQKQHIDYVVYNLSMPFIMNLKTLNDDPFPNSFSIACLQPNVEYANEEFKECFINTVASISFTEPSKYYLQFLELLRITFKCKKLDLAINIVQKNLQSQTVQEGTLFAKKITEKQNNIKFLKLPIKFSFKSTFLWGSSIFCSLAFIYIVVTSKNIFNFPTNIAKLSSVSRTENHRIDLINELTTQINITNEKLHDLSLLQGSVSLYKFNKPSLQNIKQIQAEYNALEKQLVTLQAINLKTSELKKHSEYKQITTMIQQQFTMLNMAIFSCESLLAYLQEDYSHAELKLNELFNILQKNSVNFTERDKKLLLNRSYNFKGQIAIQLNQPKETIINCYELAYKLLPHDNLTLSNYGGILTDLGRSEGNNEYYIKAHNYYKKIIFDQLDLKQQSRVYVSIAYNSILLAEQIQQNKIQRLEHHLPIPQELWQQAENWIQTSISIDPNYLNAYIILALLRYNQQNYFQANKDIDKALNLQRYHPTALMRKGLILYKLGYNMESLRYLKQAKEILIEKNANQHTAWIKNIDSHIAQLTKSN